MAGLAVVALRRSRSGSMSEVWRSLRHSCSSKLLRQSSNLDPRVSFLCCLPNGFVLSQTQPWRLLGHRRLCDCVAGSAGEQREACVADIPAVMHVWSMLARRQENCTAWASDGRPDKFRHRRGICFIDNTAALMALIRGRSDSPDLERMSNLIHTALYSLECWRFVFQIRVPRPIVGKTSFSRLHSLFSFCGSSHSVLPSVFALV